MKYFFLTLAILLLAGCGNKQKNQEPAPQPQSVKLFYYDATKDTDDDGNILCSEKGLVSVDRTIDSTGSLMQETIKLLLEGKLSDEEKAQNISTEFPLPGLSLESISLGNGVLTLEFNDPQSKTSGGACRVTILQKQVEATAQQFGGVESVRFLPEEIFQP